MTYAENFKPMALIVVIALALVVSNTGGKATTTQANMQIQMDPGQSGKLVLVHFGFKPQAQTCSRDTQV
jgi:hypothetical protein